MPTYKIRFLKPTPTEFVEVEAASTEEAMQDLHDSCSYNSYSYIFNGSHGKEAVSFALLQDDTGYEGISRFFEKGIFRKGVPNTVEKLYAIAKALKWEDKPEELLSSNWPGEEQDYKKDF